MKKRLAILLVIGLLAVSAIPVFAQGVLPAYQQSFEQDTAGWITDETPGPAGWCGDITRYARGTGPVAPSRGHGYAAVEQGACNEFWQNNQGNQWLESGPFNPPGGYSESWPQSGFVNELDIYLDPAWADGTNFTYANSIRTLDPAPDEALFRYFTVTVHKDSDALWVNGHEVDRAGWYTFRFEFTEEVGHVAVRFELADRGRVLFDEPLTTTAYSGEATASLSTGDFGTGYVWFVTLSEGLELPIDHRKYRPGK